MDHLVSTFCVGKFEPLAKYFQNITVLDLTKLERYEIISSIPMEFQFLLLLFLKDTEVEKILRWSKSPNIAFDYNEEEDEDNFYIYENVEKTEEKDILNFCNKISRHNNIKQILSHLKKQNYTYLDFSWNRLYDRDLTTIVNAIKDLNVNIKAINLSCNDISAFNAETKIKTDENLHYLLENCEYVDITMNPFVSVNRKDFFKSLEENNPSFLLNLIWIPELWIEKKAWQGMVCKELHDEIRTLHKQYYRWVRTLPLD